MTEQEIRDKAPSGATHYKKMMCGDIMYFKGYKHIWNSVKHCFEPSIVFYFESELTPI